MARDSVTSASFNRSTGFVQEVVEFCSGPLGEESVSHAKPQRKPLETRQRFPSLRLCVKHLPSYSYFSNLGKRNIFRAKAQRRKENPLETR
jgi:hypothetical protein